MAGTGRRVLAVVAIAGLLASCSGPAASAPAASAPAASGPGASAPAASGGGASAVSATLKEWQISLSSTTLGAGKITFSITNNGDKEHEFVVRKTDLKSDALPLNAAGEVSEDAPELTEVGDPSEVAEIAAGSSDKSLTVTLQPGHYVIFCNLHVEELLHYQKGMHVDFTVN
jgi:uncharacterized cupredoxin-like copper-binding protein